CAQVAYALVLSTVITISRSFNSVFKTRTSGKTKGNSIIGGIGRNLSKGCFFDPSLPQLQFCSKTTRYWGRSGNYRRAIIIASKSRNKGDAFNNTVRINNSGIQSEAILLKQSEWYKPENRYQFFSP